MTASERAPAVIDAGARFGTVQSTRDHLGKDSSMVIKCKCGRRLTYVRAQYNVAETRGNAEQALRRAGWSYDLGRVDVHTGLFGQARLVDCRCQACADADSDIVRMSTVIDQLRRDIVSAVAP